MVLKGFQGPLRSSWPSPEAPLTWKQTRNCPIATLIQTSLEEFQGVQRRANGKASRRRGKALSEAYYKPFKDV